MSEEVFSIEGIPENLEKKINYASDLNHNPELEIIVIDKKSKSVAVEDFEVKLVLGTGGFGKVFQVKKLTGTDRGQIYAMKVLKKAVIVRNKETKTLETEINLHAKVRTILCKFILTVEIMTFTLILKFTV